jgi:hypothetical protein
MHKELAKITHSTLELRGGFARNIDRRLRQYLVSANADIMCPTVIPSSKAPATARSIAWRGGVPFGVVSDQVTCAGRTIAARRMHEFGQYSDGSPFGRATRGHHHVSGDFQLAQPPVEAMRGFEESLVMRGYSDSNVQRKAAFYGFHPHLVRSIPVFHFQHYPDTGACGGNTMGWNDRHDALEGFDGTKNPETWGFADREFPEEVYERKR